MDTTSSIDKTKTCDICYRIACRECDWIASNEEVLQIQNGYLTACPRCGWKPKLINK